MFGSTACNPTGLNKWPRLIYMHQWSIILSSLQNFFFMRASREILNPHNNTETCQLFLPYTNPAKPCITVTSPPPLVAIRPHTPQAIPIPVVESSTSCPGEITSSPTMQPVLKIRPLSNVSIAKATAGPKGRWLFSKVESYSFVVRRIPTHFLCPY